MSTSRSPEERFWDSIGVDERGCWIWLRGKCKGYGRISVNDVTRWAHRFSWEIHHGPIPKGLCVLHRCDNPPCCNPGHLFLGSKRDNAKDRDKKGRQARQKGEAHGQAKLTSAIVRTIRESSEGTVSLAKRYSVSAGQISDIKHRKAWRHIR